MPCVDRIWYDSPYSWPSLYTFGAANESCLPVTHQSQSPTWLSRRSKHRVWLKDVQLYVFCSTYHQENMRQNKSGAFEIYFDRVEGA